MVPSSSAFSANPFIDGSRQASDSEELLDVFNPSTGMVLGALPVGSSSDANRAVASSRQAFEVTGWRDAPPSRRKGVLHRLAELIAKDCELLDTLDAEEMGKPIGTAAFNARSASALMHFNAEAVDKITGEVFNSDPNSLVLQRRVPRGVVAAIVPWNFPTFNAVLKVAPALAAGNSVVLKPSELSTRSALRLAELAVEANLPVGVLNVVPGQGETIGRALGLHRDVDMVAFTGSTEVGKLMLQYSGQSNMKAVQAETGGKSPHIVFADGVDLDAASLFIASHLLTNQGQICSVGSRVLVERSILELIAEKISDHMESLVMGDACDPATTFGPLVSAQQCERVMRYVDEASRDGVQCVRGGRRALLESGGYFVEPTIFVNVPPQSRLAQEEIFGPVLAIIPFDSEEEAIRIANQTIYGLAAYVWTANVSTGMRVAKSLTSMVLVNAAMPSGEGAGHAVSWDPAGQSGFGTEGGMAGFEGYSRRQLIWVNHD